MLSHCGGGEPRKEDPNSSILVCLPNSCMCEKSVSFITKALQKHYMRRRVWFHAQFCWTGNRWISWKTRPLFDHWTRVKQKRAKTPALPKRR